MKKSFFSFRTPVVAMLLSVATFTTSCDNDDNNQPTPTPTPNSAKTITQIVIDDPNFSFLEAAVIKAGTTIQSTLSADAATLTVFAPDNDAFKAAGYMNEAAVTAEDATKLVSILSNHVLVTNRSAESLANGEILTNASTKSLVVSKSTNSVVINNATVKTPDIVAKNGRIHTISAVMLPRTSILDAAIGNANLSLLATAVANVSRNTSTNVAALLVRPTDQKLTVFAPTNAAFEAANFNQSFLSNTANAAAILNILTYHVLNGQFLAAQVPAGPNASVNTFDGTRPVYTTRTGNSVFVNGIPVATANVEADNGVVHVMGSVLIPASGTLTNLVATDARFARLLRVIQYVDANTTPSAGLANLLSGTASSPFTVFAPVNAAFNFLDANSDNTLSDAELATVGATALAGIVRRHVVTSSRTFSSDLSNAQVISAANGTLTVAIAAGVVTLTPNTTPPTVATVAVTNVMATNGVAHAINNVLR